ALAPAHRDAAVRRVCGRGHVPGVRGEPRRDLRRRARRHPRHRRRLARGVRGRARRGAGVGRTARRHVLVHGQLGRGGEAVSSDGPGRAVAAGASTAPDEKAAERVPRVLAADDDPDVLAALKLLLKAEGFELETATSPALALAALEKRDFDAALLDLNYARDTTSGREGLELVERLRALDPTLPVVVMTAWGSVEGAVAAVRRGARDYVQKPWENVRLVQTLRTQLELGQALRIGRRLEAENQLLRRDGVPVMIADSPAMRPVLDLIARVAPSDAHLLITGEHGTGKELVARILHSSSARAQRALVTVNVGRLAE